MNERVTTALIAVIPLLAGRILQRYMSMNREALADKRRRRSRFWDRRVDAILDIERKVGQLHDRVTGYRPLDDYTPTAMELYADLENSKGLITRYETLWAALNDFNHAASLLIIDWQRHETAAERDSQVAAVTVH